MIKFIHQYFRGRFERYYLKNHWHLVLDLSLTIVIICLLASVIGLYLYRPTASSLGTVNHQSVDLNNPPLAITIVPAAGSVDLESGTLVRVDYKNNGAVPISSLRVTLESTDNNFSVDRLEKAEETQSVEFNGTNAVFTDLSAGVNGQAGLKVFFTSEKDSRVINWRARLEYMINGQTFKQDLDLQQLKIKADLKVTAAAYYTSPQGDQLGIGPVPPVVGLPTNYWIFIEAQSQADWQNLVVSARLPKGVELTDSRSLLAGDFKYNASARQLIWKIARLAGRTEKYHLGFEVQLTPTAAQAGQVLPLLNNLQYYASDTLTAEDAAGTLDNLSTSLDKDRFNAGQGQVQAE